jgi:hypothetical protein
MCGVHINLHKPTSYTKRERKHSMYKRCKAQIPTKYSRETAILF